MTGGGSRNLAGAAQGLPPGVDCGGVRGYRRCWADPMAGLANASTMGLTSRRGHGGRCGGSGVSGVQVRTAPRARLSGPRAPGPGTGRADRPGRVGAFEPFREDLAFRAGLAQVQLARLRLTQLRLAERLGVRMLMR